MKLNVTCVLSLVFLCACAGSEVRPVPLSPVQASTYKSLQSYKFVVVTASQDQTSAIGNSSYYSGVSGTSLGVHGSSSGSASSVVKTFNIGSIVEGNLLKKGILKIENPSSSQAPQTLVARYAESGRREIEGVGYALEVTVVLAEFLTNELVFSCTAEGIGSTEVDDLKIATNRCLSALEQ